MLPANRTTKGPRNGYFEVTCSWNGKHPDLVPYSGSMGNVSCHLALTLSQRFEFVFVSRCRKECALVRRAADTFVPST